MLSKSIIAVISSGLCLVAAYVSAAPPDFSKLREDSLQKWAGAEVVLTGKFAMATAGPVGLSKPPLRTYQLAIDVEKVLRGPAKFEKQLRASYSIRQDVEPVFPDAKTESVMALQKVRGGWVVQSYEELLPGVVEQVQLAAALPLGWNVHEGKLVSPWASVGKPAKGEGAACSVTGRPVLLAGPEVRWSVEPVPPPKAVEFANPDGDGEFKLTVTNDTDHAVEVPALLTDGKEIQWKESVVIRCQKKSYPIPGATGDVSKLKPATLQAGEAVTGTVNAFELNGPMWPMGGYRIEFQFCLGEKSATQSFYYLSRHHDPIRAAVLKGK